jgi:hypothetical protein
VSLAHLEAKHYDVTCKCLRCDKPFKKRVPEKHYLEMLNGRRPDPPCPRKACKEALLAAEIERKAKNLAQIIASQRAPGTFSNGTRAIDATDKIVSADYGMTNLRDQDRVRPNETSVAKLPSAQQEAVDNFWGGPKKQQDPRMNARMRQMGAAAMAGGLAGNASADATITAITSRKYRPPVRYVNQG